MNLHPNDYILLTLLLLSLFFDLTKKKIPNFLTFPVILWGLISYTITAGLEGFLFSLYGLLLGIAIFFIPFLLGGMGGGDVKLLGAIGAMKGAQFVFYTAIITALCGGILAVIYLIINGQLLRTLKKFSRLFLAPLFTILYFRLGYAFLNRLCLFFSFPSDTQEEKKVSLPYGVPIVLGTLIVLSSFEWKVLSFRVFL